MMWIKIKMLEDDTNSIYLPQNLAVNIPAQGKLKFGLRCENVNIRASDIGETVKNNSFDNPSVVKCSKEIIDKLLINDAMVYQLVPSDNTLNIGPVIGFLLGEQHSYYHDTNMAGFTKGMEIYPELGGLYIAFRDMSIDWEGMSIKGLYFDYKTKSWKYGTLPLPSVVFRRAFHTSKETVDRLRKLTGDKVFNSTRLDKWEIYNSLKSEERFNKYLPRTEDMNSTEKFDEFIKLYGKVILKPAGLSRGRGICFVRDMGEHYGVFDFRKSDEPKFHVVEKDKMDIFLIKNNFINKSYIIQQQIELAKINGAPFDIRVVMGKNPDKTWHCRGIECRLAGPKNTITNISRGGQALTINNAVRLSLGPSVDSNSIKKDIISISKLFCSIMDNKGEHFGEFGLDLAIDENKNYWFIEANVRPVFRGFKRLSVNNYLHIRHMPLVYAASLAGFKREARSSETKI